MRLERLLENVDCKIVGDGSREITGLACDTSKVKEGCLFFCINGRRHDGHNYFRKALGDGAVAIVCERKLDTQATQVIVKDARRTMAVLAKSFYGAHADDLKFIGIVGTNGKTSISYILEAILSHAGYNVGVIGTNGVFFNGRRYASSLTTPDPIELHYWFEQMYLSRVKVVVLEVSAHAIYLQKVYGVKFDFAVFTNLSHDHLDYFRTMENYARVKESFFCQEYVEQAIVNVDDDLGRKIAAGVKACTSYALAATADVTAECETPDVCNFVAHIHGISVNIQSSLRGRFNVYNLLAAITCAAALGVDTASITEGIALINAIEGRNETFVREDGARIVVDFAHTPDGVDNILSYLKRGSQRLIVVFGCGGNRDKLKRPLMAQAVARYADYAIVTNDNPRFESPIEIVEDIVSGLSCEYKVILNRAQAVREAIRRADSGDVVAVLGKGAESYQEVNGRKILYSDVDAVCEILRNGGA